MLKACGHPCCLCIFSYPISSFQSTLHAICFDTALLEQPPLSVITLCDLPSLWKVSMFVFWTIAKSAVFPIIVVSKNNRYLQFILYGLGMARYHFFRTDTDPIPKILSICRYRYRSNTSTVFLKSVYNFYITVCVDLLITLLCFTHNWLNIDNFTVKKNNKLMDM